MLAILLAGCATPQPEADAPPVLEEARAFPSAGTDCATRNGAPDTCVVVRLRAGALLADDPAYCAHWFGYTADGRAFGCLDANATMLAERSAAITLWMVYPERDASAVMTNLVYIVPGETNVSVEWVAPQD